MAAIKGAFGDPWVRVIRLDRVQKNGLWLLWYGTSELLRQEGAADTGFIPWGCTDIFGGRGSAGILPQIWEGEEGAI